MRLVLTKVAPYRRPTGASTDCWRFRMWDRDSGFQHQMMVTPAALEDGPEEYLTYLYKSMGNAIAQAIVEAGLETMTIIETTSESFDNPESST
jgi:hypothetical protein